MYTAMARSNGETNDLGLHAEMMECAIAVIRLIATTEFLPLGSIIALKNRFSKAGIIASPFSVFSIELYVPRS